MTTDTPRATEELKRKAAEISPLADKSGAGVVNSDGEDSGVSLFVDTHRIIELPANESCSIVEFALKGEELEKSTGTKNGVKAVFDLIHDRIVPSLSPQIKDVCGTVGPAPRLEKLYQTADDVLNMPEAIENLRDFVGDYCRENLQGMEDFVPNVVKINVLRDGHDYIGMHSEKESSIKRTKDGDVNVAMCFFYGKKGEIHTEKSRQIRVSNKKDKSDSLSLDISNCTCVAMSNLQRFYKYGIPQRKGKVVYRPLYIVTFRQYKKFQKKKKKKTTTTTTTTATATTTENDEVVTPEQKKQRFYD